MPKPNLWRLGTTCPIQQQWEPQMPPAHSPDRCTGRVGEHDQSIFCSTPLGWHCGCPSATEAHSPLLLLEMKPAASPMTSTYSNSALKLLMTCEPKGYMGPGNYFYPFSPILSSYRAESKWSFVYKLKGGFGFGLLCKHVCHQNTKQRIMWRLP